MESHKEKILTQLFKKRLLRPPELLHEAKKKLKSISKQDVDNFYQNYSNIEFAKRIPYKKFPRKMPLRFAVSGYPHQEVYIDTMYVDMCLTPLLLLPSFFPSLGISNVELFHFASCSSMASLGKPIPDFQKPSQPNLPQKHLKVS